MLFRKNLQMLIYLVLFLPFLMMISCRDQSVEATQKSDERLAEIHYSDTEIEKLTDQVKLSLSNSLYTPSSHEEAAKNILQKKNSSGYERIDEEIRGIRYSMIKPDDWNRDLVLLVHGGQSVALGLANLAEKLTNRRYGVAGIGIGSTTLKEGVKEAIKNATLVTRLIQEKYHKFFGLPHRIYLLSFSRGAHISQRLLETSSEKYDGYLTVCGGNGGTQLAWDHNFTSRLLFDYFFPGIMPGNLFQVPPITFEEYTSEIVPRIIGAILNNPSAALQMGNIDQYHLKFNNFDELVIGIATALFSHTIAGTAVIDDAGGIPFDNSKIEYTGTTDDETLNSNILRVKADRQAREFLKVWYEPDGSIKKTPVIILHTTRDPLVPEKLHNDKYETLLIESGNEDSFIRRPKDQFGHCPEFSGPLVIDNFLDLTQWVETGEKPAE